MHAIRVPSLAENVNEATIGSWLVREGQRVEKGQSLVELLTEKAEFTLEAEEAGTVTAVLAPARSVLPVGYALAALDADADQIETLERENRERVREHANANRIEAPSGKRSAKEPPAAKGIRATPAARRLAREQGVDLAEVAETLRLRGAVKEEHVREFIERG